MSVSTFWVPRELWYLCRYNWFSSVGGVLIWTLVAAYQGDQGDQCGASPASPFSWTRGWWWCGILSLGDNFHREFCNNRLIGLEGNLWLASLATRFCGAGLWWGKCHLPVDLLQCFRVFCWLLADFPLHDWLVIGVHNRNCWLAEVLWIMHRLLWGSFLELYQAHTEPLDPGW